MMNKRFDKYLYDNMEKIENNILESTPDNKELEHNFSEKFYDNKKYIIKKIKLNRYKKIVKYSASFTFLLLAIFFISTSIISKNKNEIFEENLIANNVEISKYKNKTFYTKDIKKVGKIIPKINYKTYSTKIDDTNINIIPSENRYEAYWIYNDKVYYVLDSNKDELINTTKKINLIFEKEKLIVLMSSECRRRCQ